MKHPFRRRLMYLAFQGLRALIRLLPVGAARALGRTLGAAACVLLPAQRRLTRQHLEYAFGASLSPAERSRICHGVFRNLGQTAMEWLLLPRLSTAQLQQLIRCEGLEHLRGALARGNGVIALTAHFGNWELIPLYLRSLGFEGGVLARRLRYPEYESFLIALRGARGVPTIARGALKEVAKLLRANQIVGMLPDQDIDSLEGIFVDFFGRPAYTPIGPAALSLMTGAPVVPCFTVREGEGFRLIIEPPLEAPAIPDRTQAMRRLTEAWTQAVEERIRRSPDQWVWMHRRWKTQPSAVADDRSPVAGRQPMGRPALAILLAACCLSLACLAGCGKRTAAVGDVPPAAPAADPGATEQMSGFTLTGYEENGTKRWTLNGQGASVEGDVVTVLKPDAVHFDPARGARITASAAQIRQRDRHVRLEHDVTIHTSDGLWFAAPLLYWMPDRNEMATDAPVRLETDHMLVLGRGAHGLAQLKQATIERDIEVTLNPSDEDHPGGPQHVRITCEGPLAFDYEQHIATFEQNVHVQDSNGDLYSDKLVAYLDERTHTVRYAEATGRVRIHQNQNTAVSERAIYEPARGKITLVGRPSLLIYPSEETGGTTQLSFGGLAPAEPTASDHAAAAN